MHNPRIRTFYDWVLEILSMVFLIASFYPLFHIGKLNDVIPVHFNIYGEADGWGNRNTLCVIPLIAVIMYILLSGVEKYYKKFNYPVNPVKFKNEKITNTLYRMGIRLIRHLKLFAIMFFCYLSNVMFEVAVNKDDRLNMLALYLWLVGVLIMLLFFAIKMFRLKYKYQDTYR
jgi:hypothetical protein